MVIALLLAKPCLDPEQKRIAVQFTRLSYLLTPALPLTKLPLQAYSSSLPDLLVFF